MSKAKKSKLIINNKEYVMPKLSADQYMNYLDIAEKIDGKTRYTRTDIEAMIICIVDAYGNQFTVEELKNPETGLDVAGIVLEFEGIDMGVANELQRRIENFQKNLQSGN